MTLPYYKSSPSFVPADAVTRTGQTLDIMNRYKGSVGSEKYFSLESNRGYNRMIEVGLKSIDLYWNTNGESSYPNND
jgi:hypothetical protein